MRKWIGLILIIVISSNTVNAEAVMQLTQGIANEQSQLEGLASYVSRQLFNTILEEQHLSYLINESSNQEITLKEAAYAWCQMINEAGVYLPESEGINNPYIGELVLLGIWQEPELKEEHLVTSEAWERTYERILRYQEDKQVFTLVDQKKEAKLSSYRQKINTGTPFESIKIGKLTLSHQEVAYGDYTYPIYTFLNTSYIGLKTLKAMGFSLEKEAQGNVLTFEPEKAITPEALTKESIEVSLSNSNLYYHSLKTYSLQSDEEVFIPLRALEVAFNLNNDGVNWVLEQSIERSNYLSYKDGVLYNESQLPIEVTTTSYYWNGEKIIEDNKKQYLESGQTIENPRSCYVLRGAAYLNTMIKEVTINEESTSDQKLYGQQMDLVLKNYEKARLAEIKKQENKVAEKEDIEALFPPAPVYATLKVATQGLKKGEKVELYREDNGSYTVITVENKKIKIPKKNLTIPSNQKVTALPATKVQIETYINKQNIESSTNYLVWTDLYRQTTYVLKGRKNEWELIKRMMCSTGKNETPTPRGFFTLQNKVPSFGQEKGYTCKNAYGFIGSSYLYHSILYDKTGSYIIAGKKELGQKASHGCIRLLPEESLWLYNTMPKGTKVWIN